MIFYIHHIYSYELFWYFFHGVDVTPNNVPTWFYKNRHNKHNKIDFDVSIEFTYNEVSCKAIFCEDRNWDNDNGYHILDYTLDLIQKNIIADRGWNKINDKKLQEYVSFLNKKSNKLNNSKILFFYIDWEPSVLNIEKSLLNLNSNIITYTDVVNIKYSNLVKYSFTHFLSSFIFPNTIYLKDFYYIADYLKTYDDYECKINYPIRRIDFRKINLYKKIKSFNNDDIRCTLSSFTDYKQHENEIKFKKKKLNDILKDDNSVKYIKKRGYNLDDWGGEWNDNNMKEFMWKLLTYSNINIVWEAETHVTEKSIGHILAGKPFIPQYFVTVSFFNNMFARYNLTTKEYPFNYTEITQMIDILDETTKDNLKWNYTITTLQKWVDSLRYNFIECIHHNNDMLDDIFDKYKHENKDIFKLF